MIGQNDLTHIDAFLLQAHGFGMVWEFVHHRLVSLTFLDPGSNFLHEANSGGLNKSAKSSHFVETNLWDSH